MNTLSFEELLALPEAELTSLKEKAGKNNPDAQCTMALRLIYGQKTAPDFKRAIPYLEAASEQGSSLAMLLLGFCNEFSADEKSYGKCVSDTISCYSRGYDLWNGIENKADSLSVEIGAWWLANAPKLRKQISEIINIKDFCVFADNCFWFDWSDQTRKKVNVLLLKLASSVKGVESVLSGDAVSGESDKDGALLYQLQDTLLMPLEVIKAVAGRDALYSHLTGLGYSVPKHSRYLDRAMGRCLIDDDDKSDNDFIISGLKIIAGLGNNPQWAFRTGLWYEYDPESKDLVEACRWYEKAGKQLGYAAKALARVKAKDEYKLIVDPSYGTAADCIRIAQSYSSNLELANIWNIRAALRGDVSAVRKLEQTCTINEDEDVKITTQYETILEEVGIVKSTTASWAAKVKLDQEQCFEEMAQRAKDAEAACKRAEEERALAAEKERISKLTPSRKFEEGKQLIKGKDYDKGIELIKMASGEGHADATIFLALGFKYGVGGVKRFSERSDEYFISFIRQADESHKDYPRAHYELALRTGRIDLLQKAAELGYVDALSTLAFGYDFGNGFGSGYFPKDEILALKYYEAFVSKGDKSHSDYKIALYNMGQMYYFGTHGVSVDKEKAISYYKQSAELGYSKAKDRLNAIEVENKKLIEEMEEEARKQIKAIEDAAKAAENRKKSKKRQVVYFVLASLTYLFFTIKAGVASHPFWVLFWGVVYTFYCLVWGGGFGQYLEQKKRNPYWFVALIPVSITSIYFIVRALELAHPFWVWLWIVIYVVSVAIDLTFYYVDSDASSNNTVREPLPKTKWQQRLEEAQKMQEQMMSHQKRK